ncbi:hypothetical protein BLA13014_03889 [Burkholderia aenigmatica]|uniref:Uncharacterized protein n=1 Tax=Burkholderia aenigmatica TaxID=2015348 RepID=A0A6P2MWD1_9BURK|nr:hypothetical protein BLA13014_03889 [Burkholderia aenigmatica]
MVYSGGLFTGWRPVFGGPARDFRSGAPNGLPGGAICPAQALTQSTMIMTIRVTNWPFVRLMLTASPAIETPAVNR